MPEKNVYEVNLDAGKLVHDLSCTNHITCFEVKIHSQSLENKIFTVMLRPTTTCIISPNTSCCTQSRSCSSNASPIDSFSEGSHLQYVFQERQAPHPIRQVIRGQGHLRRSSVDIMPTAEHEKDTGKQPKFAFTYCTSTEESCVV